MKCGEVKGSAYVNYNFSDTSCTVITRIIESPTQYGFDAMSSTCPDVLMFRKKVKTVRLKVSLKYRESYEQVRFGGVTNFEVLNK